MEKIAEAQIELKELDARLQVQRKEVLKRSEECKQLLEEISEKTASAKEMEAEALEKKGQLDVKQAEITVKKGEADIELAAALPALEEARKAVKEITTGQVAEIRYVSFLFDRNFDSIFFISEVLNNRPLLLRPFVDLFWRFFDLKVPIHGPNVKR